MGAREDLLSAARRLLADGQNAFSPAELIASARSMGSTYPDTTLRTMIVGPMCINSPDHHAVQYADLERTSRAEYRLLALSSDHVQNEAPVTSRKPLLSDETPTSDQTSTGEQSWFWEGNVQAAVVRHLAAEGWDIIRVADTASRESGIDIEARLNGERLIIEVKGYPEPTYKSGPQRGEAKKYGVGAQARTYFGNALLSGLLLRSADGEASVVLAFPDVQTFRSLATRTAFPLAACSVEIWLISEAGEVAMVDPSTQDQG